jgi:ABC-type polysaccharide/polyol phosphate transport system ATPase subunit
VTEAIAVRGVRVEYRPYAERVPTLRKAVARARHRETKSVVALDDVTFAVDQGDSLGVIGANGAGKSTLLRVVAGTLRPDAGEVDVRGVASTLLQLGAGFNPDLPGRMNVMLAGLASGLTGAQVRARFDDIVGFAEMAEAIDRPVKTYSSGMFSRLAFAVAMHLEPDVLLVDEVLAVGDESFRRKSEAAMEELLGRSATLLFVSHTLTQVESLCRRALWLDHGRVRMIGASSEVVAAYREQAAA